MNNETYEVWQWSPYNFDYTSFVGYYNTRHEAERAATLAGDDDCIIIEPSRARIMHLNGDIVVGVRDVHWHGGEGYVSYYSLFTYPTKKHIGFVKQSDVSSDEIDESKVIYN